MLIGKSPAEDVIGCIAYLNVVILYQRVIEEIVRLNKVGPKIHKINFNLFLCFHFYKPA